MKALNISDLHQSYLTRTISPSEVVRELLSRIDQSKTNSFLTVCRERALAQARDLDVLFENSKQIEELLEKKPLFGIPIGVKDAITVRGVRTTAGSRILENYVPPFSATVVNQLEQAGCVILGKLNMDEFAMGSSNENSAFGAVLHPTHPDRVAGGSSGGSACAVREGLCSFALGSDTGGSIRLPASFCGVTGVKPTYGRVSRYGLIAFASSLDQIGPLSLNVEDSARVLEVISGKDPMDATSAPVLVRKYSDFMKNQTDLSSLKIGVPKELNEGTFDPEVENSIQEALRWFESRGAKGIEISLPHSKYAISAYYIIALAEASSNLSRYDGVEYGQRKKQKTGGGLEKFYSSTRSLFGEEVKRRILLGTFCLSSGYYDAYYKKACQVRRLIRRDFDQAFNQVDLILSAVSPSPAFRLGERTSDPLKMYLSDVLTVPSSLAGVPALSVPSGENREGLPIGLQLIGPSFQEERLLQIAHCFEKGRV